MATHQLHVRESSLVRDRHSTTELHCQPVNQLAQLYCAELRNTDCLLHGDSAMLQTSVKPPIRVNSRSRSCGIVQIAKHQLRSTHTDLTMVVSGTLLTSVHINQLSVHTSQHTTCYIGLYRKTAFTRFNSNMQCIAHRQQQKSQKVNVLLSFIIFYHYCCFIMTVTNYCFFTFIFAVSLRRYLLVCNI